MIQSIIYIVTETQFGGLTQKLTSFKTKIMSRISFPPP